LTERVPFFLEEGVLLAPDLHQLLVVLLKAMQLFSQQHDLFSEEISFFVPLSIVLSASEAHVLFVCGVEFFDSAPL